MAYCIILHSHDDPKVIGYYDGTASWWTTDPKRRKFFESAEKAAMAAYELRQHYSHTTNLISVRDDFLEQWVAHEEAKWLTTRKVPWWKDATKVAILSLLLGGAIWAVTYVLVRSVP